MPRIVLYTVVLIIFFSFGSAYAANTINWTFYGPGAKGRMQGPMTAASNNLEGNNSIRTLDDVRTGKSKYVTLASANSMRGRYYCIGTVTYTSPSGNGGDGKTHTIENVVGYVHDTGCAFNGTCSCGFVAQFCDGKARPEKMDIAIGNFTGYEALEASNYIIKNPNRAPKDWTQLAGLPQKSAGAQSAVNACGGEIREQGMPTQAPYVSPPYTPQPPATPSTGSYHNPQTSQSAPQPQSSPTGGSAGSGMSTVGQSYTTPSYAGTPMPTTATNIPTPNMTQSPLLTTLFQQSSATSGIRSVQNTAQAIVDLFTVPNTNAGRATQAQMGQNVVLPFDVNASNVSLMAVSQLEGSGLVPPQNIISSEVPRPNNPVLAALQQESTFDARTAVQTQAEYSPATTNAFLSILASFRTLFESMMRLLTRS